MDGTDGTRYVPSGLTEQAQSTLIMIIYYVFSQHSENQSITVLVDMRKTGCVNPQSWWWAAGGQMGLGWSPGSAAVMLSLRALYIL